MPKHKSVIILTTHQYMKFYSLLKDLKTTEKPAVLLDQAKPSRPDYIYHKSRLKHCSINDLINLLVEQVKANACAYRFQLHCVEFHERPFFRFDSYGAAHQNKHLPLKDWEVNTPHFNSYDENGVSYAYQTEALKNIADGDLINMNRFFHLFCSECHLRHTSGTVPDIIPGAPREFPFTEIDPLSGIKFDV